MTLPQNYPKAPITEAIIDLRVKFAEDVALADLKKVADAEQPAYPKQDEIFEAVGHMAIRPGGGSASVQQTLVGWKSISEDGKQIFQSRVNGFTYSRLAPYDRWEVFHDEAKRLWGSYRDCLNPNSVVRLAVRYINRIDIPGANVDLKQYFRTSPEIAPELPQHLEGYFMQLRLPFPDISGNCVLNQTIVPPPHEGVVSVVLDLDLFRGEDIPQDEQGIWTFFDTLRDAKNRVFEACITDLTRSLISSCRS